MHRHPVSLYFSSHFHVSPSHQCAAASLHASRQVSSSHEHADDDAEVQSLEDKNVEQRGRHEFTEYDQTQRPLAAAAQSAFGNAAQLRKQPRASAHEQEGSSSQDVRSANRVKQSLWQLCDAAATAAGVVALIKMHPQIKLQTDADTDEHRGKHPAAVVNVHVGSAVLQTR